MTSRPSEPRRYYWDEEERVLRNKPKGQNWHLILVPESAYDALRQQLAEMRGAVDRDYKDLLAVLYALRDMPTIPVPRVLNLLSKAGKFPSDWETGKRMQNEHGLEAIPPNTECEIGAGFWNRLSVALAPTSQPSREPECACGHPYACGAAEQPSRGKCETCGGKRWIWPATETDEIPCYDCAQPSLPVGYLATAIEDAQRTVAGWPEDVRAAMGVQPERQGADPSQQPGLPVIMELMGLTSTPQDDIVAGLRDCLIHSKPEGDEAIVPIKLWERAIAALERR